MGDHIKDGGPAFPHQISEGYPLRGGMTLRDWFAGQASCLPRSITVELGASLVGRPYTAAFGSFEHWQWWADAEAAWKMLQADAMIAAKLKGPAHG